MKLRGFIKLHNIYSACVEQEEYVNIEHRKAIFNWWERKYEEGFYDMFIHIVPITNGRVRKSDGMNAGAKDTL